MRCIVNQGNRGIALIPTSNIKLCQQQKYYIYFRDVLLLSAETRKSANSNNFYLSKHFDKV